MCIYICIYVLFEPKLIRMRQARIKCVDVYIDAYTMCVCVCACVCVCLYIFVCVCVCKKYI